MRFFYFTLTEKLTKTVKLHCGYIVTQNLMVIIVNYLQNELRAPSSPS